MQSINLQIAPGSVNPVINVSQNDVGRQFQLKLYDGAAAYTLPTGTTASIEGIKPDGHAFSYSDAVSVSGSILTVTTKLQMTVVAGRVICEIRLRKSGLDLGSLNFVMLVEESPINENVDPSDTEIPAIIELAEGQVEDAEAWARGTKNGEPVPSTAPQFQNNAQWYAEHVAASLDALSNVNITSPVNEDVLEYNSTTRKWKNSGAVRQLKQALSNEAEVRSILGAHNILPFNLDVVKSLNQAGTWSGSAYTYKGITYTFYFNDDGSLNYIDVNGTSTDTNANLVIQNTNTAGIDLGNTNYSDQNLSNATHNGYVLSGGENGIIGRTDYYLVYQGNNKAIYLSIPSSNTVISHFKFCPMVRHEIDPDTTYQPYAMTNRKLTKYADGIFLKSGSSLNGIYCAGRTTTSGNYVEVTIPVKIPANATNISISVTSSSLFIGSNKVDNIVSSVATLTNHDGQYLTVEFALSSTQTGGLLAILLLTTASITYTAA